MGYIIFNNVDTRDLFDVGFMAGVVVQTPPVYEFPSRKIEVIEIPGRNGDIVIDRNSFGNVHREYNIAAAFGWTAKDFIETARMLVDYLSTPIGYARLEDSYEPDYFRMAMFRSGGQIPNYYDMATALVLKFECKPQRFLKSGEASVDIVEVETTWELEITNPTNYIALPEISINGVNTIITIQREISVDTFETTTVVTITGATGNGCKIDSELQDCYNSTAYLNNFTSVSNKFPKLYPGKNKISITTFGGEAGVITSASIKPRWWVL